MLKVQQRSLDNSFKPTTNLTLFLICAAMVVGVVGAVFNYKLYKHTLLSGIPVHYTASDRMRQVECLAKNIYWEAAHEPFEGKVAVAQVTINRVNDGRFPEDICAVVYQKNVIYSKVVCQFSWFCETNHITKSVHPKLYMESEAVAKKVLLENYRLDGFKDALYYHADYVDPKWKKERIGKIGRHIFYKEKRT